MSEMNNGSNERKTHVHEYDLDHRGKKAEREERLAEREFDREERETEREMERLEKMVDREERRAERHADREELKAERHVEHEFHMAERHAEREHRKTEREVLHEQRKLVHEMEKEAWGGHVHHEKEKFVEASEYEPIDPKPIPGFHDFGHIDLTHVINCRDLGGLPTEDGRRVKKRHLLRSADLHHATEADIDQLKMMHDLAYVIDLRSEFEVEHEPDALSHMAGIDYVNLQVMSDSTIGFEGLKHLGTDLHTAHSMNIEPFEVVSALYPKSLLGEMGIEAYSRFLHDLLENEDGAILWHCTQGKDRTGIGGILVEYALGVSKEHMKQDYLATNLFIKPWMKRMEKLMTEHHVLRGLGVDIEAYAFANPRYFDIAFEAVEDEYGSMDRYMTKALDFDHEKRAALRDRYLE